MKLVFIGPHERDDSPVNAAMHSRISAIHGDNDETAALHEFNVSAYTSWIRNNELPEDRYSQVHTIEPAFQRPEHVMLDGKYEGVNEFQYVHLPSLRHHIRSAIGGGPERALVHVELGDSLWSLYAAYFAIEDDIPTIVTFHKPGDDDVPFAIGGRSVYGRFRPMLRRRLGQAVIDGASQVMVSHGGVANALASLYNTDMRFYGDPLTDRGSADEPDALSSETGG